MDTSDLAIRLLQGSRKIDLMREHIVKVVSMVMGYVQTCNIFTIPQPRRFYQEFEGCECLWKVTVDLDERVRQAECFVKVDKDSDWHVAFTTDDGASSITPGNTLRVYLGLEIFLAGLLKELPRIEIGWKPLIEASELKLEF